MDYDPQDGSLDAHLRCEIPFDKDIAAKVVTELANALEHYFVDPDVGRAYAHALRRKLAAGAYSSCTAQERPHIKVPADHPLIAALEKSGFAARLANRMNSEQPKRDEWGMAIRTCRRARCVAPS
jgi:hypothetical protein